MPVAGERQVETDTSPCRTLDELAAHVATPPTTSGTVQELLAARPCAVAPAPTAGGLCTPGAAHSGTEVGDSRSAKTASTGSCRNSQSRSASARLGP